MMYVVDSFTTGYQAGMLCKGKRFISPKDKAKRTYDTLKGKQKDLPKAGTYMVIVQGVFATSAPITNGMPIIRAGYTELS